MYDQSFVPEGDAFTNASIMRQERMIPNPIALPMPELSHVPSFMLPQQHTTQIPKTMSMNLGTNGMNADSPSKRVPDMIVTATGLVKKSLDQRKQYLPPLPNMGTTTSTLPFSQVSPRSHTTSNPVSNQLETSFPSYSRQGPTRPIGTNIKSNAPVTSPKNANSYETDINDGDINTIVVTNDEGEVKMTFTDNAVGQYETIDTGKSDSKEVPSSLGTNRYMEICGFTALQSKDISDSPSSTRKSDRPVKMKSMWGEDKAIPGFSNVKKLEPCTDELPTSGKKTKTAKEEKQKFDKTGNGKGSKKNKLSVDDVYESSDGGESDGDISKDILKVRMSKCETCGKHFLDKTKLTAHKRTHSKARSAAKFGHYPCEVCGYVFRRREHWRRHKLIHVDATPYHCSICNRGFKRSEHVKRHQSVHTLEKPYECLQCDKKFTRPEHLRKHTTTHSADYNRLPKAPKPKSASPSKKSKIKSPNTLDTM